MKQSTRIGVLLLVLFLLLVGSVQAQQGAVITGDAYILSADVRTTESTILLDVRVELGDACTEVGEITQTASSGTITVHIQTTRPADAMCAMVLTIFETTIPLDTTDLQPGDYTLLVNNQKLSVSITAAAQGVTEDPCPVAAERRAFLAPDGSYCFLYPADLIAEVLEDGTVLVASDPLVVPGISLQLVVEAAGERTLEALVAERQQQFAPETIRFDAFDLDGALALYTDQIPQQIGTRIGYALAADVLYSFTLQPVDVTFPDATRSAENLWSVLVESFRFLSVASANCPQADASSQLFEGSGLCFLYPAGYDLINGQGQIMIVQPAGSVVLLLTLDAAQSGTLDDLEARLQRAYPDADLQIERVILGAIEAIQTDSIPGAIRSRMAQLFVGDQLLTLLLQPIADAEPAEIEAALALWGVVSDSLKFTGQ